MVRSTGWNFGALADVGAVTLGSGITGIYGNVSPSNSLIGSTEFDRVGYDGVAALSNGNYIVMSPYWDHGTLANVGAATLGLSDGSVFGVVDDTHSVIGLALGTSGRVSYDPERNQLAVGQPDRNRVILHRTGIATSATPPQDDPHPSSVGQAVDFISIVTAVPTAPSDGHVRFATSSGESCVDHTPTITSPTTSEFSCAITFGNAGTASVFAEYLGSTRHAFSRSGSHMHMTTNGLFENGFEENSSLPY